MNAPLRRPTRKKSEAVASPVSTLSRTLVRTAFVTSRLADFAAKDELVRQIGHPPGAWPLVAMKELIDNAIDACEASGVAPKIAVTVDEGFICVADNAGGIPANCVKQILNYANKTSTNAAYRSPTRGQQGNALQTLLAMGHALTGKPGVTLIKTRGVHHQITFTVDPISREPRLDHQREDIGVTRGTQVTVFLPVSESARLDLHDAVIDYTWVNPHATLSFNSSLDDALSFEHEATNPDWTKWKPTDPTSPYWYDLGSSRTLMAAEINKARRSNAVQRTVAAFIADFRGLAGTGKRKDICEAFNASREHLDTFFARGDDAIRRLLDAMKAASKPVRPRDLGVIGEAHVLDMIASHAGRYKRTEVEVDGVPYLIECGFGHRPDRSDRTIGTGLNWSLSIGGDPFRDLGFGRSLGSILQAQYVGPKEPVAFFLHLASPCLKFRDTGKSSVTLPGMVIDAIVAAVKQVTAAWHRQRKAEERNASAKLRRMDALKAASKMSIKAAAYTVMAAAYAAASDNGALPANARQIFYAARPEIMRLAQVSELNSNTFTQQLLIGYMNAHPDECEDWDVVFSDRGHFAEPHTERRIGLGTLAVREYAEGYAKPALIEGGFGGAHIETHGPEERFGALLYVEKEGFEPL